MNMPSLHELADRLATLEQRIAALEGRPGGCTSIRNNPPEAEEIPWHLLAAAVAAMLPGPFRIESVRVVAPTYMESRWGIEGRREHFYSHRIR